MEETETVTIKFPNLKKLAYEKHFELQDHEIQRLKDAHHMIRWTSIISCFFGKSLARSRACKSLMEEHGEFLDISKKDSCLIFQDDVLGKLFPNDARDKSFLSNDRLQALRRSPPHPYWTLYFHPQEFPNKFIKPHISEIEELIKDVFDYNGARYMDDYQLCDLVKVLKCTAVDSICKLYDREKSKRQRTV